MTQEFGAAAGGRRRASGTRTAFLRTALRAALAIVVLPSVAAACAAGQPPGYGPEGEPPAPPLPSADAAAEAERLREEGPAYVSYERGPRIRWTEEAQRLLTEELLPALQAEDLPAGTNAMFWILVGADGRVWDVVLHSTSNSERFDEAAARVARQLPFYPALERRERGGEWVPRGAWILRSVSLLMQ